MLMASIVASMMMGGFLLTVSSDVEDETLAEPDVEDADGDYYAEDQSGQSSNMDDWGDLLSDILDDEALALGPEAVNAAPAAAVPQALGQQADEPDDGIDPDAFADDFDMDAFAAALGPDDAAFDDDFGPLTEDGTEVVIDDFVPGEDRLILSYDADGDAPLIELFGDPAGNALVFADGHLAIKVLGADGKVLPEDIELVPEGAEADSGLVPA